MTRQIFACAALASLWIFACQAQTSKPPARKAPSSRTLVRKYPATRPSTTRKTTSGTLSRGSSVHRTVSATAPARPRQMAPTPDRYREIQQALVNKGYLQPGDVTGVWNQGSIDALRRFQADQKIDSSGKINALSLIALGLGPRHETASAAAAASQVPVPDGPTGRER
jgi:hypothetical protein